MANLDARDALTVLLVAQRAKGIRIEERRFSGQGSLWVKISDVRIDLISLESQLAEIEAQAGEERKP